jgi:hypothetical protein
MRYLAIAVSVVALCFGQVESWLLRFAEWIDPNVHSFESTMKE